MNRQAAYDDVPYAVEDMTEVERAAFSKARDAHERFIRAQRGEPST